MRRPYQLIRIACVAGALAIPGFTQSADPTPSASPANPSSPSATSPSTNPYTTNRADDRDHDFNMGWLGLVGLAGLLGLRRHDHRNEPRNIDNTGPSGLR